MTPDDDSLTDLIRALENERYAAMIAGDAGTLDRKLSFPAGIVNFESSCGVCGGWGRGRGQQW
jgi:hypothetical protein